MAQITGLLVQIATGNVSGAGTDGNIYLGICGREFRLDSTVDDYERGSVREYLLGELQPVGSPPFPPQVHVLNPEHNDPRLDYPLDTDDLSRSPVYIRFEPRGSDDNWNLRFAAALVYKGSPPGFHNAYIPPMEANDSLWLGQSYGKFLFLTHEILGEMALRQRVRELADQLRKLREQ